MDPMWRNKNTEGPKIGGPVSSTNDQNADSSSVGYELFITDEKISEENNTERLDNGYATAQGNKKTLDAEAEERHRIDSKIQKDVLKYKGELKGLLDDFQDVFAKDSNAPVKQVAKDLCKHVIELRPGETLGRSPGMRRRSQAVEDLMETRIQEFLQKGLLRRMNESVAHACQPHIVMAPGREPRFTIDYRPVNEKTKPDSFPLPRMDELLYGFAGSAIFSTIDALKGFWQIPMDEASVELTAFRTKSGVYAWNVMPMGLMNSPATFQRFMSQCFEDLPFVRVYIDDIIIYSPDAQTHLDHLKEVLMRCRVKGITLKASKCHFLAAKLKILGYYVSRQGITQDPEKLAAIDKFARPGNLRELRRFLGMIQFFRMFSASTARILIPLYALCRKGVKWRWGDAEAAAFAAIKLELRKKRTLVYPDVKKKFYVSVDASDYAFGANLYQFKEAPDGTLDVDQVIAYSDEWTAEELAEFRKKQKVPFIIESFSKKWNKHERNYSTSEKECLAIVNALERWSHYLAPKEFEVWSDHRALTSLVRTEKPRLKRWSLRLTPFNFNLKWKSGRSMKDVDTLSRDGRFKTLFNDVLLGFQIDNIKNSDPNDFEDRHSEFTALTFREIEIDFYPDNVKPSPKEGNWLCFLQGGEEEDNQPSDEDDPREAGRLVSIEAEAREEALDAEVRRALLSSHRDFGVSQRNDPALKVIVEQLEDPDGKGGPKPGYHLRDDGVLLYKGKIVMPVHEIPLLLYLVHDHPLSGHVGANKLKARIQERFYVKKLNRVVERYLKKCSCSRVKARRTHKAGRTITFTHYGPLDCLQIDLVGPFPASRRGNKYWVTLIDRYTRCLELVPVKSKEAKVVARAIADHWVTRYGCPLVLMADNEFRTSVLRELMKLTDTKQIFTAPYRPSTNGLAERVHQFAQQLLQNARMQNVGEWDDHLPAIRFSIMSSCLDGLGFSPYQLLYGRTPRLPRDDIIPVDTGVPADVREYFNSQREVIREIREMFDYRQSKVDARMRFNRDKSQGRRPTKLKVGDLVYHTRDYYGKSKLQRGLVKLLGKFQGPSKIVKALGENTFEVQTSDTKTKVFNVRDLSLYGGEDPPIYRSRPGELVEDPGEDQDTYPDNEPKASEEKAEIQAASVDLRQSEMPPQSGALQDGENPQLETQRPFKLASSEDPPSEGQWVLAYDKALNAEGKTSLMMGRVSGIDAEGLISIHVYRPRSIQKKLHYLPMFYRYTGKGDAYEEKITDQKLAGDWLPWVVDLNHTVQIVARSDVQNEGKTPPDQFHQFYKQVWDAQKKETDPLLPELGMEPLVWQGSKRRSARIEEIPSSMKRSEEDPPKILSSRKSKRKSSLAPKKTSETSRFAMRRSKRVKFSV